MKIIFLLINFLLIENTFGYFNPNFENFLRTKYGPEVAALLKREDIPNAQGSYGGGENGSIKHKPVILVHGITNTAGLFWRVRQDLVNKGYADNEIYATTYGDGGKTNVLFVTMECQYVKVIRMMIQAVADYTNSKVNVIGYSMGSPISRKAILGGACVDTGENLGPPLTHLVDTFLGVAGANFGSMLCVFPFGSCNMNNGMSCFSRFLADINGPTRYEGSKIFTIYSRNDEKVGYQACGKLASAINGQDAGIEQNGKNHDQVIFETVELQHNLITFGHP